MHLLCEFIPRDETVDVAELVVPLLRAAGTLGLRGDVQIVACDPTHKMKPLPRWQQSDEQIERGRIAVIEARLCGMRTEPLRAIASGTAQGVTDEEREIAAKELDRRGAGREVEAGR